MRRVALGIALAVAISSGALAQDPWGDPFRAFDQGRYAEAGQAAEAELAEDPENPVWWALAAEARSKLGQNRAAAAAFARAAEFEREATKRSYYLRAQVLHLIRSGQVNDARELIVQVQADASLDASNSLDWAMVAIAAGDDETAQGILGNPDHLQSFTRQTALDAAYSAKRLGMDDRASRFFARALALDEQEDARLDPELRENIRREIRELQRKWAVLAQTSYSSAGRPDGVVPLGDQEALQSGLEVSRRFGGWRNGRPISLFLRAFHTEFIGEASVGNATQGWIGARFKPFAKLNLNVEASRLVGLDSRGLDDWSLRGAFSSTRGLEAEPGMTDWDYVHFYSDITYLLDNDLAFGISEGRYGRSFAAGDAVTITPYALARASLDTGRVEEGSLGAGAGLTARFRFDQGDTVAHRGWIDFDVQLRQRIAGDDSASGMLASITIGR